VTLKVIPTEVDFSYQSILLWGPSWRLMWTLIARKGCENGTLLNQRCNALGESTISEHEPENDERMMKLCFRKLKLMFTKGAVTN
jgi:hypothetical protein